VFTFPYYLIPGAGSYTAILAVARLARVARVLMATRGLRRLAKQLGKVVSIAGIMLVICSLAAYEAERKTNPEFGSIGDAFWWGITTLTTVGYGDIVPVSTAGRIVGAALMLAGVSLIPLVTSIAVSILTAKRTQDLHDQQVVRLAQIERQLEELRGVTPPAAPPSEPS
jgi:voltage-gated potassium channel